MFHDVVCLLFFCTSYLKMHAPNVSHYIPIETNYPNCCIAAIGVHNNKLETV